MLQVAGFGPWLSTAYAQPSRSTAEQAVRSALDNPNVSAALDARVAAARAHIEQVTAHPVPTLGVAHEQVLGDLNVGYRETTVTLQQEIDLSGWRSRRRGAARHREAALRAEGEVWRLEVAAAVRTAFYAVVRQERRLHVIDEWIDRLREGHESVEARRAQGDAALYYVRRIEREIEISSADRASAQAALAEAWAELMTLTRWESRPDLQGALRPQTSSAIPTARHHGLLRLEELDRAVGAELDAEGSALLRGWTFGAGYRRSEVGSSTGNGFEVSLSFPLALWNPRAPRARQLRAERAGVRAELALRRDIHLRAMAAAEQRLARALGALDALVSAERDAELTNLARTAFAAGEATLTELLDAFESEARIRLARVDLEWEARRAAIEFDFRRGVGAPDES